MSTLKVGEIKHESFTGTTQLKLDSAGRLLVGTTTEGQASADDLTIATTGNTGITVRSGTSNAGNIYFSDATSGTAEYAGYLSYSHSTNSLSFGTNDGTERMRIDSSGNVGIGMTTVGAALDVNGASGDTLRLSNGSALYQYRIGRNSTDGKLEFYGTQSGDVAYSFSGVNGERLRIDSSGNVGIGVIPKSGQYSGYNHLQVGESATLSSNDTQGDTNVTNLSQNVYLNSNASAWKYLHTDEASKYEQSGGNHYFQVAPSGSADATVSFSNILKIDSDGIKFNNDTAAANALDDYEEGTWTPTNTIGLTITNNNPAYYLKIGKLVMVQFDISFSGAADSSQCGLIQSLPFTSENTTNHFSQGSLPHISNTSDFKLDDELDHLLLFIAPNESRIDVFSFNTSTLALRGHLVGRRIRHTMFYKAA